MDKLRFTHYTEFAELPLDHFNELNFSVYVLDKNWNYLFVNRFVKKNLGDKATDLIGKNMWEEFKELATDPSFILLKRNTEKGLDTNFITTSPVNSQRLNVIGHPLKDCYLFSASILPKKEDLIDELRNELTRKNTVA
jgi:hypothetical protein